MGTNGTDVDHTFLAKYPFLPQAADWVRESGPTLEDLLTKRVWARARTRGRERVDSALDAEAIKRSGGTSDDQSLLEVCSYVVARLVVCGVGDEFLARHLATAEARGTKDALDSDTDVAVLAVASGLGMQATFDPDGRARVRFVDFLRHARALNAMEWKLVNQQLDAGEVVLGRQRFTRLIQEAVRAKVELGLAMTVPQQVLDALAGPISEAKARVLEVRTRQMDADFGEVRPELFPPCMANITKAIKGGVNMSHEGRFAVVAFLHTIGVANEAIIGDLFSSVPDFAKDITQYQVEHITGVKSGTEYTPPGCSTLQTYGLCPFYGQGVDKWDRLCAQEWMTHPLKYYRAKKKRFDAMGGGQAEQAAAQAPAETAPEGPPATDQ